MTQVFCEIHNLVDRSSQSSSESSLVSKAKKKKATRSATASANKKSTSIDTPVATTDSSSTQIVWSELEQVLFRKLFVPFGEDFCHLSQALGSKTCAEVRLLFSSFSLSVCLSLVLLWHIIHFCVCCNTRSASDMQEHISTHCWNMMDLLISNRKSKLTVWTIGLDLSYTCVSLCFDCELLQQINRENEAESTENKHPEPRVLHGARN